MQKYLSFKVNTEIKVWAEFTVVIYIIATKIYCSHNKLKYTKNSFITISRKPILKLLNKFILKKNKNKKRKVR